MVSGLSQRGSTVAPSLLMHDYCGKKQKILQTLKQIDDIRGGVVKAVVFENMLNCLDVDVDPAELSESIKRLGLSY